MAKCMFEASQHSNEQWECVLRVLDGFCSVCSATVFLIVDLSLPAPPSWKPPLRPEGSHGCSWCYSVCWAGGVFFACGAHQGHTEAKGLLSTDMGRSAIRSDRELYPWRHCRHSPCSLSRRLTSALVSPLSWAHDLWLLELSCCAFPSLGFISSSEARLKCCLCH